LIKLLQCVREKRVFKLTNGAVASRKEIEKYFRVGGNNGTLLLSDIITGDKMNVASCERIISKEARDSILKVLLKATGLHCFLDACASIHDAFQQNDLDIHDRVELIWFGLSILRAQRNYVLRTPKLNL